MRAFDSTQSDNASSGRAALLRDVMLLRRPDEDSDSPFVVRPSREDLERAVKMLLVSGSRIDQSVVGFHVFQGRPIEQVAELAGATVSRCRDVLASLERRVMIAEDRREQCQVLAANSLGEKYKRVR